MQLTQMRLRIKAIETIKKITNAMRLISMSMHIRLNHKVPLMQNYKQGLLNILNIIQTIGPLNIKSNHLDLNSSIFLKQSSDKDSKTLIIIAGSQKGLAGTFNSGLFKFFEKNEKIDKNIHFIFVGKKSVDYLKKHYEAIKAYNVFNFQNLDKITKEIYNIITQSDYAYTNVFCYSNYSKGFLTQLPHKSTLIPLELTYTAEKLAPQEEYIWPQEPNKIYDNLIKEYLKLSIHTILFESLIAEQAARFQSMDNATRNANELLETMKRQYNKLRQTKITKEISEISSSL